MAILGSLIKTAIELKDSFTTEESPIASQKNVLKKLLEESKETAFGKYYAFSELLETENLQKF